MAAVNGFGNALSSYATERELSIAQNIFIRVKMLNCDPNLDPNQCKLFLQDEKRCFESIEPAKAVRFIKHRIRFEPGHSRIQQALQSKDNSGNRLIDSLKHAPVSLAIAEAQLDMGTSFNIASYVLANMTAHKINAFYFDCLTSIQIKVKDKTIQLGHQFVVFGNVTKEEIDACIPKGSNVLEGLQKLGKGIIVDVTTITKLTPVAYIGKDPVTEDFVRHITAWNFSLVQCKKGIEEPGLLEEADKILFAARQVRIDCPGQKKYMDLLRVLEPDFIVSKLTQVLGNPWKRNKPTERVKIWCYFSTKAEMLKSADYLRSYGVHKTCGFMNQTGKHFIELNALAICYEGYENMIPLNEFTQRRNDSIQAFINTLPLIQMINSYIC